MLARNALLVLTASLASCSAPTERGAPASRPIQVGVAYTLRSDVLGAPRQVNVWTPPAYADPSRPPAVVFLLDGGLQQDFEHIAGIAQLAALSQTFGPLIVVGVETVDRQHELTAAAFDPRYVASFPRHGGAETFRAFLEREVKPFVAARYPHATHTVLMGESLAGFFVVDTFLRAPGMFDDYVAVSPSLWWDDRALVRDATRLLRAHDATPRRLYLTLGDEPGTMEDGMDRLRRALASDAPSGLTWTFRDRRASDTHATIFHAAALDALRWLYSAPPVQYGVDPWYLIEGGSPP